MLRYALLSIFLFVASAFAVYSAARIYSDIQAHQRLYSHFSEALTKERTSFTNVKWQRTDLDLPRFFSKQSAASIGHSMTQAWRSFAFANETRNSDILADYFTGPALARAQLAIGHSEIPESHFVVLQTLSNPLLYHLDRSVVRLRSRQLSVRFSISDDLQTLNNFNISSDDVQSIMTNETTGWRFYSHEMLDAVEWSTTPNPYDGPALYGVNYYPADTPWSLFWQYYEPDRIREDFKKLSEINANAVRIFIPRDILDLERDLLAPEFRYGQTSLRNIADLLAAAEDAGVYVIPTLFDLYSDHRTQNWADDAAYLEQILPVLAAAPSVAYVDLKNEPDLDFKYEGAAINTAWLTTMLEFSRLIQPDLKFTIGWSHADFTSVLADKLDLITYHDYADVAEAEATFAQIRAQHPDTMIMVTEIGYSSWEAFAGQPATLRDQAKNLDQRLRALTDADGIFIWSLLDFNIVDEAAVGPSPWTQNLQRHFGLYDGEGAAKPARNIVRQFFYQALDTERE